MLRVLDNWRRALTHDEYTTWVSFRSFTSGTKNLVNIHVWPCEVPDHIYSIFEVIHENHMLVRHHLCVKSSRQMEKSLTQDEYTSWSSLAVSHQRELKI